MTSPNHTLPWSQIYGRLGSLIMRVNLVISNYPFVDLDSAQSRVLLVFSCKVCDGHETFRIGIATESDDILILWIQDLEPTVDEDVFVLSAELQATLPIREDRLSVRDLSCCVDIRVVVIDSHPWLDVRLAESSVRCRVPLHGSSGMVTSLELE
jgi:hypothetical protein